MTVTEAESRAALLMCISSIHTGTSRHTHKDTQTHPDIHTNIRRDTHGHMHTERHTDTHIQYIRDIYFSGLKLNLFSK